MMGTVRRSLLAAVLLLASSGLQSSSALPACPHSCTCPSAALVNCSSSGLSIAPQHIQDSVTELDLSHNLLSAVTLHQPHRGLRGLWLSNNSIPRLSLCIGGSLGRRHVRGGHGLRPWSGHGCISWAPTLQLLSVQRNQLVQLPEGLHGSEALQVLQLSFNKITTLRPEELQSLQQLRELHLQHNLITSLHPQIVRYLPHLKVLDVSFNMLTSLHPSTYLSLRNIGADVSLHGNRWQCDCNLRSLRRWMVYDSSRGLLPWSVVCASPSILSGTDLLELEDNDLNCFTTENKPQLHQDVTVYRGSEILLSCFANDSFWWTSNGQTSEDQTKSGLFISDITERDAGIYVCVSDNDTFVSVYNLHISTRTGATRNTRSLSRTSEQIIPQGSLDKMGPERNQTPTQNDLILAVCLSIFITFLLAFILGVLARPFIEVLCRRVREKRSSPATNPASTVHDRQYDNEAFCDGDDPEEARTFRERRVTFSTVEYREDHNVQYYDTLVSGVQDSVNDDAVFECEASELNKQKECSSTTVADKTHNLDAAELKERRNSSSSSDSSTSDKGKVTQKRRTAPKPPQQDMDAVQQRSESSSTAKEVVVPQISMEGQSETPGFSSHPFEDWSPHTSSPKLKEEQFEFSDSNQSTPISSSTPVGSFNKGGRTVASTSDIQRRDSSSSSSYLSDGEPSHYTVNPNLEEKGDMERNYTVVTSTKNKTARRTKHSVSSTSSDSDGQSEHPGGTKMRAEKDADVKAKHVMLKKWQAVNLAVAAHSESSAPAAPSASSDSDTEEKITDLKMQHTKGRVNEGTQFREDGMPSTNLDDTYSSSSSDGEEEKMGHTGTAATAFQESQTHSHDPETKWPIIEFENIPRIKRLLDVKAPSQCFGSSSNTDTEEEKISQIKKNGQWEGYISNSSHHSETQSPGGYLDIKATVAGSHSSSSSDSEEESSHHTNKHEQKDAYEAKSQGLETQWPHPSRKPGKVDIAGPQSPEPQTGSPGQEKSWPSINLDITPVKRRMDIKASLSPDSSSSSESEDEMKGHVMKEQVKHPIEVSRPQPQTHWPAVDLEQKVGIKRRLDFKASTPASTHSFSHDSKDGTADHIQKQEQEKTNTTQVASDSSSSSDEEDGNAGNPDPKTQWPLLDLERATGIKRRLDVQATSPISDSSSSSDSEDETAGHLKKGQGNGDTAGSQTVSHDVNTEWPASDLQHIPYVKRRLDMKKSSPPPDSSSSSDSENETKGYAKKERPWEVGAVRPPFVESQTGCYAKETKWPSINLDQIPPLKRHLDIKAPSIHTDSASSDENEDEIMTQIKKEEHGETHGARPDADSSYSSEDEDVITVNPDPKTQWPTLDLEHIPPIKRRLDIKERSPVSDSSSDSDSEDDTKVKQKKQWPLLDLQHTTGIKRRLDVKAPKTDSDSSSSASSEDETTGHSDRKPGKVGIAGPQSQEQEVIHLEKHQTEVAKPQQQTLWPAVDLEQKLSIKRRLDFKATPPASTHSSSSVIEDGTAGHIKIQEQEKTNTTKVASDSSSSSDDEDGNAVSPDPKKQWPLLDLERTAGIKRRLDVKATSPISESSSTSDGGQEATDQAKRRPEKVDIVGSQTIGLDVNTKWPALDLEHIPHIKRRLDIKARSYHIEEDKRKGTIKITSKYSPSSSDEEETNKDLNKAQVASCSQSNSSTSDTEDENSKMSKSTMKEIHGFPQLPVSHSATNEHSIKLDKYTVTTVDSRDQPMVDNSGKKLEEDTALQSQWAMMNLGFSRFRKHSEIRSHKKEPPKLPSSPPPDSSSSSSSEDDTKLKSSRTKQMVPENKRPISTILRAQDDNRGNPKHVLDGLRKDHSTIITGRETNSSTGTLNIRRSLDFKVSEKPSSAQPLQRPPSSSSSSSSSENEDETTAQTRKEQGALSISQSINQSFNSNSGTEPIWGLHELRVPRLARRLDIKASQTNSPPSCSSEDEKVLGEKPRDESSPIPYRRTIMKDSSLQSDSFSSQHSLKHRHTVVGTETTTVQETSLSGVGVRKKSFRSFTEVDLPPELQWTGIGRYPSGISSNRASSRPGVSPTSPLEAPPALPQQPLPANSSDSSSSESDDNTEQDGGKANVAQIPKYSSLIPSSDSYTSFSRPLDRVDGSSRTTNEASVSGLQDRRERKGLSALKAMSSDRQIWETEAQKVSMSTSLNSDLGQQRDITLGYRRSEDRTASLTKQSKPISSTSSSSMRERRVADVLYRFPSYRTHAIGDLKPPQEAAPPVPETPPPDEALELTWRSRSSKTL